MKGTLDQHLLLGELAESFPRCGCGDPEGMFDAVRDTLSAYALTVHAGADGTIAKIINAEQDGPAFWLWLYTLDGEGLLEHGTNIRGSWLTEKGTEIGLALHDCGCDPFEWIYHPAESIGNGGARDRSIIDAGNNEGTTDFTEEQWARAKKIFEGE